MRSVSAAVFNIDLFGVFTSSLCTDYIYRHVIEAGLYYLQTNLSSLIILVIIYEYLLLIRELMSRAPLVLLGFESWAEGFWKDYNSRSIMMDMSSSARDDLLWFTRKKLKEHPCFVNGSSLELSNQRTALGSSALLTPTRISRRSSTSFLAAVAANPVLSPLPILLLSPAPSFESAFAAWNY